MSLSTVINVYRLENPTENSSLISEYTYGFVMETDVWSQSCPTWNLHISNVINLAKSK